MFFLVKKIDLLDLRKNLIEKAYVYCIIAGVFECGGVFHGLIISKGQPIQGKGVA